MPKYRLAAYFYHRFRHVLGLLTETGAKTTGKNHCFHKEIIIVYLQLLHFTEAARVFRPITWKFLILL